MTFFINQALMMFAGWDKISRETNTRIPEYFDGWGMDVKNAWNERTVDTIPYVSISLYPYIFISSTKTGSQYFLTSIYRLQDINSIFCRILFYFHGNHRFCIQRWFNGNSMVIFSSTTKMSPVLFFFVFAVSFVQCHTLRMLKYNNKEEMAHSVKILAVSCRS